MSEFDQADQEAEVLESQALVVSDAVQLGEPPRNIVELRDKLIAKYHNGASSLLDRLQSENKGSLDALIVALVDEVIHETDSLLGNELVAAHSGNLRDASIISYKRSEVLEKAIKAVQAKQIFERDAGVDVFSPTMAVVFQFFMMKVQFSLKKLGYEDEAMDVFFKVLGESLNSWQKELQEELSGD